MKTKVKIISVFLFTDREGEIIPIVNKGGTTIIDREIIFTPEILMKIALFFIGRKRPGFEPAWGAFIEKEIRSQRAFTV